MAGERKSKTGAPLNIVETKNIINDAFKGQEKKLKRTRYIWSVRKIDTMLDIIVDMQKNKSILARNSQMSQLLQDLEF